MISPVKRVFQRYLIPRFIASIYFYLRYRCLVSRHARVQVSGNVTFGAGTVVKPYVIIQTHQGRISLGKDCAVSSFDHISTGDGDIILGDTVRIAPNVTIVGGTKAFRKKDVSILDQGVDARQGVTIGSDVLIGAGTVILPGCAIGDGVVIGAGSVVTGEVEAYSIVAGAPARVVGQRE
jgi:acetyltransferase-like isoleucine patch superfamily enzyme